ncbi:MAG TPA: tRNA-dihydrouridine synthase [Xanthobacteraceae bacterium]|nr:tRNA-dihydrouridine synthase [Xanthobacteraceae bacterium]
MPDLSTRIGRTELRNPVIAGPADHFIDDEGVRAAIKTGVGAVVLKSVNETQNAKDQLQSAEYLALDEHWRPVPWGPQAPRSATIANRTGLGPASFDEWLDYAVRMDREARACEVLAVASIILADMDHTLAMARRVEQAGIRVMELNIGTPYAREAKKNTVTTELNPARVEEIVSTVRKAVSIPIWVKTTGQSERVPDLAEAAFRAGADSVIMAGRLLGLIPDVDTMKPMLDTALGIGGYWNLPMTCYWLAVSRSKLGSDKPLIGINGAQNGLDVARMMLAGASAVQIASAVQLRGYDVLANAVAEFARYVTEKNVSAMDLVGRAADARKSFADMPPKPDNWRKYIPGAA